MSFGEVLVILAVALLVLKPKDLLQIAQFIGRNVGRVKFWVDKIKKEVQLIINEERAKKP